MRSNRKRSEFSEMFAEIPTFIKVIWLSGVALSLTVMGVAIWAIITLVLANS